MLSLVISTKTTDVVHTSMSIKQNNFDSLFLWICHSRKNEGGELKFGTNIPWSIKNPMLKSVCDLLQLHAHHK